MFKRKFFMLLAALCLWLTPALGEGLATPADLAPEQGQAETQEEASSTPLPEETAAPPEASPTPETTAEPVETPPAETAPAATEEPAGEEEVLPTEAPTPAPTEEPAWDESACDHMNAQCHQAPHCDEAGCGHIGQDAHGLETPLCALGRWLLDRQDAGARAKNVRHDAIDLNKADAVIYRSGSYSVRGGNLRPGATLTVAEGRLVVLEWTDVALGEMHLGASAQCTVYLRGESRVQVVATGKGSVLHVAGGGALTADAARQGGEIRVKGGSVLADWQEHTGRTMYAFDAKDAASITVEGQAMDVDGPHRDGKVYLWLKDAEPGKSWRASRIDSGLVIAQQDSMPQQTPGGILTGEENHLRQGQTVELQGEIPPGTKLVIDQEGVTVILRDAAYTGMLVEATCQYTLFTRGKTSLTNPAGYVLGGPARVEIFAEGVLTMGDVQGEAVRSGGLYVVAKAPAGWTFYEAPAKPAGQKVLLDGRSLPLMADTLGRLCLPTPQEGMTYAMTGNHEKIDVHSQSAKERWFTLTDAAPNAPAGDAQRVTVEGRGGYVTGSITGQGAAAEALLRRVQLQGSEGLLALSGAQWRVTLEGDNGLAASQGDAVVLTEGAKAVLHVTSGRLLMRQQRNLEGITLRGNIKVEPEPALPHLHMMIRDAQGNPVPNTALTLRLAGETYHYTTHFDGSLHLWGLGDVDGRDISATDGEKVYTAVVMGGEAQMTTGLAIEQVTLTQQDENTLLVDIDCQGAGSLGVQYRTGSEACSLPDSYDEAALRAEGGQSSIRLEGLAAGEVVSLRAYVSAAENAALTPRSADGFQFSRVYTCRMRAQWQPQGSADAVYTGRAYRNPIAIPQGAAVRYEGHDLDKDGLPWRVGEYTMVVTIPQGHKDYLPDEKRIPLRIDKAPVAIIPGANLQKYQGQEDPPFPYEAQGLLEGDTVQGLLKRQPGEEVGNYPFLTDGLEAPDYYRLYIPGAAGVFTILPAPGSGGGLSGMFEALHPVNQQIIRRDGRLVQVVLNTQESLKVNSSRLGSILYSAEDKRPRPFSPSLEWNEKTDQVLLRLRAEAELNKDGGYMTDLYGKPRWGGRYVLLNWMGICQLQNLGVDALCLHNHGAALTLPLPALQTSDMEQLARQNGVQLSGAKFRVEVVPEEAEGGSGAVSAAWRMAVTMEAGGKLLDVTNLVEGLNAAVDMEELASTLAAMELYDEDDFARRFGLAVNGERVEAAYVIPFTPEEEEATEYPHLMYASRYLACPLAEAAQVYVVQERAGLE